MGLVQLLRCRESVSFIRHGMTDCMICILTNLCCSQWRSKCSDMANAQHTPDAGAVRRASHGYHNRFQSYCLPVLMHHSMVWAHMAHWLYCSKSIHMGLEGSLHPSRSAILAELHLVCDTKLERRKACHVSRKPKLLPVL